MLDIDSKMGQEFNSCPSWDVLTDAGCAYLSRFIFFVAV